MKNKFFIFALISVFFLAFLLRFYKLGDIPSGLYQDETAIGYNAFSILKTGRDEHSQFLPIYFKSFGDYKLPVYVYLTAISVKLFGLTEFAVRFPSALFGFLSVIVFYFLVKDLSKKPKLALAASLLLAINPWSLHYNRATFEVSVSLFLYLLGALLIPKRFLLGTLCFILSLYTYNLTRLLSPLLYLVTLYFNKSSIKLISRSEVYLTIFTSIILLLPFVSTFFNSAGIKSASGTLIWSSAVVQASLLEFRSYLIHLPSLFTKLFFNMPSLTFWQYLNNLVNYLSPTYFFVSGSTHGNHGIGNVGLFYLFEFPLMIIGLWHAIKQRLDWIKYLLGWVALVIMIAGLTREAPHATRSFFLLFPLIIFSAQGLTYVYEKHKSLLILGSIFIIYNLIYYFSSYYIRFPVAYAKAWRMADRDLSFYLNEHESSYNKIIIDSNAGFIYSSLLFYNKYDPQTFQSTTIWTPNDSEGFSMPLSFGKYEFRQVDWSKDREIPNSLIVTAFENKPENSPLLTSFYYPEKPVVIALKQQIANYPARETAYVLIETAKK